MDYVVLLIASSFMSKSFDSADSREAVANGKTGERRFQRSWERCVAEHNLDRGRRAEVPTLTKGEIREQQSTFNMDTILLGEELARIRGLVDCAGYAVTVANREGTIIQQEEASSREFYCRSDRVGSIWREERSGTSGIGTCLIDRAPVTVFLEEHFFEEFSKQSCVAVPMYGCDDQLVGILNLSTENPLLDVATHRLAMRIAVEAAERLDERFFRARHRGDFVIRLREAGEASMLLAVDEDGCIRGADRNARLRLSLPESSIGSRSLWGVFEQSAGLSSVRDLLRGPQAMRALTWSKPLVADVSGPTDVRSALRGTAAQGPTQAALHPGTAGKGPFDRCVGGDREMARQIGLIRRMLDSGLPILALGETGVGKDTLARAIHEESSRASGPFVAFNCAAVPETLIDSELFGYGGGAFTGARKEGSPGRLVEASGGTLFLDEIGDMPVAQQTRLLRVLESGEVMPLGGGKTRKVDLQIVAATHQDIQSRVARGSFRQDLFYRLAGAVIRIPALRERDDVEDLFCKLVCNCTGGSAVTVSRDALAAVRTHRWPGNIREMKHVAQRAVRLCADATIMPEDLMLEPVLFGSASLSAVVPGESMPKLVVVPSEETARRAATSAEREAIIRALSGSSDKIEVCAQRLGMSRATLYRKMKAHGLAVAAK